MLQAVIFDFDGLILDTEWPDFQSWQEIYQDHGVTLSIETWLPIIGTGHSTSTFDPYEYLEAQSGKTINREEIRKKRRQSYLELVEAQPLLPGVEALIMDAKQHKLRLAVASSSSREWVGGHLTRRGLATHFECILCGSDVAYTKPYPDVYEAVLSRLGIQPHQAIALEDSANGVQAAKQAGIFCVAIPNRLTQYLSFDHANVQLASLADVSLTDLIKHFSI